MDWDETLHAGRLSRVLRRRRSERFSELKSPFLVRKANAKRADALLQWRRARKYHVDHDVAASSSPPSTPITSTREEEDDWERVSGEGASHRESIVFLFYLRAREWIGAILTSPRSAPAAFL